MARDLASKTFWRPSGSDDVCGGDVDWISSGAGMSRLLRRWVRSLDGAAVMAALLYAALGGAWVLWSDQVLFGLSSDPVVLRTLSDKADARKMDAKAWENMAERNLLPLLLVLKEVTRRFAVGEER